MVRVGFPSARVVSLLSPPFSFTAFCLSLCWYLSFRLFAFVLDKLSPATDEVYARFVCWVLFELRVYFLIDLLPFPGLASGLRHAMERLDLDPHGNFVILPWQHILLLVLFGVFLWAFFSVAVCRCLALVQSGSVSHGFREALSFSLKRLGLTLKYAGFLATVIVMFFLLGGVLGLMMQIPLGIGKVLSLVAIPILLLFSFFIFFVGVVGMLCSGFFCNAVTIGESRGIEPFLRTFGLVYSKPMAVVLYGLVVFLFISVLFFIAAEILPDLTRSPIPFFRFDGDVEAIADKADVWGLWAIKKYSAAEGILFFALWLMVNALRWVAISGAMTIYFSACLIFFLVFRDDVETIDVEGSPEGD